jgi:long-chain acyl-CoA synthetase
MKHILITGSTGSLGKHVLAELTKSNNVRLTLFVRDASKVDISHPHVEVYKVSLQDIRFGLPITVYKLLQKSVQTIVHMAASTRFTTPLDEARVANVVPIINLATFAKSCPLERFVHVSTAFVAGRRSGRICENELYHEEGFLNTYEQTKFEAECILKESTLPLVVLRPSLLINTDAVKAFSPFQALSLGIRAVRAGLLPYLPGSVKSTLDITDIKCAAQMVVRATLDQNIPYGTYHLAAGDDALTVQDILDRFSKLHISIPAITFCSNIIQHRENIKNIPVWRQDIRFMYRKTESFLEELAHPKIFETTNALRCNLHCAVSKNIILKNLIPEI